MVMETAKCNISRSKKAMYRSLLKLLKKKDFSEILVQNILDDCGYSRSCFYHNFEDKYNMLTVFVQDEAKAYIDFYIKSFTELKSPENVFFYTGVSAFEFIYSEKEFYTALISGKIFGHGQDSFFKMANEYFVKKVSYTIEKECPDMNINLYASALTSIMGAFVEFWVKDNFEHSPEYMQQQITLVLNSVNKSYFINT